MGWLLIPVLAGCAGGAAGDWNATGATSEAGESVASGILEVDRDGEVLLDLTLAGDGPTGTLSGQGVGTVSGTSLTFTIAADWTDEGQTTAVSVEATCESSDAALACGAQVDDASWTLDFVRESGSGLVD